MTRIESLLRKEIGLDAASIGSTQILRTVRLRMKNAGLKKIEDYEQLLKTSPTELNELIEAVVVTETWFFRDREPFATFTQLARQWLTQHPGGTLRALSVPCSSGEEPYSLAMSLLDAQIPPHRFAIDAVDISARALARAKNAVYGKNSFRGQPLTYRDQHFTNSPNGTHYTLNPRVRACVNFHQANLLGDDFLTGPGPWNRGDGGTGEVRRAYAPGHAPYDFIFCRNLLIYFDRATQEHALEKIHRLLAPQGVLFVGPAELPVVLSPSPPKSPPLPVRPSQPGEEGLGGEGQTNFSDCGFTNAGISMAFACRKSTGQRPESRVLSPQSTAQAQDSGLRTQDSGLRTRDTASGHWTLDAAQQLADAGRLDEAAAICENHLRKEGPSARAYYLLGLVTEASDSLKSTVHSPPPKAFGAGLGTRNSGKATEFYRKALYLEPNHYESLLHMALLLEKNGDVAGASTFKRRAERAQPKT